MFCRRFELTQGLGQFRGRGARWCSRTLLTMLAVVIPRTTAMTQYRNSWTREIVLGETSIECLIFRGVNWTACVTSEKSMTEASTSTKRKVALAKLSFREFAPAVIHICKLESHSARSAQEHSLQCVHGRPVSFFEPVCCCRLCVEDSAVSSIVSTAEKLILDLC
jgi:hypothetical protein